jgi:hypothetical protein
MQNAVIGKQIKFGTYLHILPRIGFLGNIGDRFNDSSELILVLPFDETIRGYWGAVGTAGESGTQSEER